ncbi:MAG: hypothetical protein COY80_02530 [Candidatus Pacebacteria bacterium CG_4_10_14_0_8_um_filter_42_14]|nr:MAG: hypothetical protein COY80_02530 [Candidatus Pacebacteria bacterium CG_4_10_14_0_8_um_filter_42_14]
MTTYLTSQLWTFSNQENIQTETCEVSKAIFPLEPITASSPHALWINLEQETIGIEVMRILQEELGFSASASHTRYVIILQADQLTDQAQHALLKLLEEPGKNTQIILATSKPQRLLATIRSRCIEQIFASNDKSQKTSKGYREGLETFDSWQSLRLSQAVIMAEKYKKRDEAKETLERVCLAIRLERMPKTSDSTLHATQSQLQFCLGALELLGKNIHPQLVMEDLFFRLNNLEGK